MWKSEGPDIYNTHMLYIAITVICYYDLTRHAAQIIYNLQSGKINKNMWCGNARRCMGITLLEIIIALHKVLFV